MLSQRLSLARAKRDLVRVDRVGFDATVTEERSRWSFSTVRGSALRWGLKKLSMGSRARVIRFLDDRHQHAVESAKTAKAVAEWEALSLCPLCGQAPESQDHWIRVRSHPAQMTVRARAYQTLTSLGADLSPHKQTILRVLTNLS